MAKPTLPLGAAAVAAAALALAGCGGGSHAVTATPPTAGNSMIVVTLTTATSPSTTTTPVTDASAELRMRLPAQHAVGGLRTGVPLPEPTAGNMVTALYASGDPAIPAAIKRLDDAGYSGGVLRDQRGKKPTRNITLFRIYAYRLRDHAAATADVNASFAEVRAASGAAKERVRVPGVPTAKGLLLHPGVGTVRADVLYVTWSAGADAYGMQAFARHGTNLHRAQILALAKRLYLAWGP